MKRDLKSELNGYKTVKINGHKFVIKKLNPLLDFNIVNMPQIFVSFKSRRPVEPEHRPEEVLKQMMSVVEAGLVSPELVPIGKAEKRGKENGITVEDIFRDMEIGSKLYSEILLHSLNRFKGIKGVFFSLLNRLKFYIELQKNTVNCRLK